ncbi:MAG: NAD(P)H-dependent glycerol-3-phosphate dehydrogenase [Bacteroidales bacterium]|nr:NAD(P)H-dependent glycerol-3-phosphate dehydrogenase [Bacteroidales bacterium]
MNPYKKIGVVGNGSWATALMKLLTNHNHKVFWHIRKQSDLEFIKENHRNPRYLSELEFDNNKINYTSDINEVAKNSEVIYFVVPSAFLDDFTKNLNIDISKKIIVSGIKGIIPSSKLLFAEHFNQKYNVPIDNIAVIAGPSHAEEIAKGRLSYLTIASKNLYNAETIANQLECQNLRTFINDDIYGIEYAAVLKNIYALASGVCQGLGFGDNFISVLISNAITETERFIKTVIPEHRNILSSAYLGDLLATSYSKFSRNRTFGMMIGKGYSVKAAKLEMNMIAEGYYATESFFNLNLQFNIYMPILEAIYNILYNNKPAGFEIKLLTHKIR